MLKHVRDLFRMRLGIRHGTAYCGLCEVVVVGNIRIMCRLLNTLLLYWVISRRLTFAVRIHRAADDYRRN